MTDSLEKRLDDLEQEVKELREFKEKTLAAAEAKRADYIELIEDIALSQQALAEVWYHVARNKTLAGLPRPVWSVLMEGAFQRLLKRLETAVTSDKYEPLWKRMEEREKKGKQ